MYEGVREVLQDGVTEVLKEGRRKEAQEGDEGYFLIPTLPKAPLFPRLCNTTNHNTTNQVATIPVTLTHELNFSNDPFHLDS